MKKRKYEDGTQSVGARPKPPKANVGKMATDAFTGTASGVAAGAAGGPPGMIIGGALGLASSLVGSVTENEEMKKQYAEDLKLWKDSRMDEITSGTMDFNELVQQHNQLTAKYGIYRTGTQEVEVEKDELIFTKSPTGKYILKADFVGGKRHDQGGEDYQATEGDIIFPGKDRKKVMAAYKQQDFPKLEAMRLKLPKDGTKAEDGLDNTDPNKKSIKNPDALTTITQLQQEEERRIAAAKDEMSKELRKMINGLSDPKSRTNIKQVQALVNAYNLDVNEVMNGKPWSPESGDYNYGLAIQGGLSPDSSGHWPSRLPQTGAILKGSKHPTYQKSIEAEKALGNEVIGGHFSYTPDQAAKLKEAAKQDIQVRDAIKDAQGNYDYIAGGFLGDQKQQAFPTSGEQKTTTHPITGQQVPYVTPNDPGSIGGGANSPSEIFAKSIGTTTNETPNTEGQSMWDIFVNSVTGDTPGVQDGQNILDRFLGSINEDFGTNLNLQLGGDGTPSGMIPGGTKGRVGPPTEEESPRWKGKATTTTTKGSGGTKKTPSPFPTNLEVGSIRPQLKVGPEVALGKMPEITGRPDIEMPAHLQRFANRQAKRTGFANFDANKAGNIAGYVAQASSALSNLFPGEIERRQSPLVNLDNLRYEDTSGYLRQQAEMGERVAASNARNVSGGNVQNYMANKRQANLNKLRQLQGINAQEYQRAMGIANQNVGINNQERMMNNQIRREDMSINEANRGMYGNIRRQGIGQLGELGGLIAQESNARDVEQQMIRTLNDMGLYELLQKGGVQFKNDV